MQLFCLHMAAKADFELSKKWKSVWCKKESAINKCIALSEKEVTAQSGGQIPDMRRITFRILDGQGGIEGSFLLKSVIGRCTGFYRTDIGLYFRYQRICL